MTDEEPILVPIYNPCGSAAPRFFRRNQKETGPKTKESELLRSIRAVFQSLGKEPNPTFRTTHCPVFDGSEEELSWNDKTVVWSSGGIIRRKWSFDEEGQPVQFACLAWMDTSGTVPSSNVGSTSRQTSNGKNGQESEERHTFGPFFYARRASMKKIDPPEIMRAVYVFLRSFGRVFFTNGLEFTFSLPFVVRQAWPLYRHGVLIQRVLDPTELEDDDDDDFMLPTLYTLTNPFQEPRPVGLTEGIKYGTDDRPAEIPSYERDGSKPQRYIPAEEHVLWVAPRSPDTYDDLVVTIDSSRKKLSFWRYVYVAPNEVPTTTHAPPDRPANHRLSRRATSISVAVNEMMRQTSASVKDLIARDDRIREPSPEFEPTQPAEFAEMPPLSALPSMPPELSTTTTLASLASGSSLTSQWLPSALSRGRRNSLTRNDLTSTMDRMVLGRRSDMQGPPAPIAINEVLQPVYWMEKLCDCDKLTEKDSEMWRKITFSIFDHRFNGARIGAIIAVCLPASEHIMFFTLNWTKEGLVALDYTKTMPGLSAVAVKATRPHIYDLLVLKQDSKLALLTFNFFELPLQLELDGLVPKELDSTVDVSMKDANEDGDLSMTSVVDRLKVVSLRDSSNSMATIVFEDRSRAWISVDFSPNDPLVLSLIQNLSIHMQSDLFFRFQKLFTRKWVAKRKSELPDVQFDCLAEAILGLYELEWLSDEIAREQPTLSPFDSLMRSSTDFRLHDDTALQHLSIPLVRPSRPAVPSISGTAKNVFGVINLVLNIVGEDMRLSLHKYEGLARMARFAVRLCQLARPAWTDYWKRLFPDSGEGWITGIELSSKEYGGKEEVLLPLDLPSVLYSRLIQPDAEIKSLEMIINRKSASYAFGQLHVLMSMRDSTALIHQLSNTKSKDGRTRAETTVAQMTFRKYGLDYLSLLPLSLAIPLREAARTCQLGPPSNWPLSAYEFVGRKDLTEALKPIGDLMFNDGYKSVGDHLKPDAQRKSFRSLFEEAHRAVHHIDEAVSGVELELSDFTDVRFGQDRRLQEVQRMLRSSNIPSIRMIDRPELSEHEVAKEQQNQVLRTAERTLALPLGRAMFTFGSVPTVRREVYTVPKIELSIRLQPQNIVIAPEPGKLSPDALQWAEFHNGVAAGLRISPASDAVDSSWIAFNRPNELTAEHAGFLFGLGLTGHLKEMLTWHTFGYLTPKHDLTSIAVLLGLSAANVGSGNKHVTKLLAVHTPALLPSPDVDLNVPLATQAAGLVGIGLLYMGSKNRRLAEVALHQIGRGDLMRPDLSNENREAYTIASALSFGMIMLGRGAGNSSPADAALLSHLRILVHGAKTSAFHTKKDNTSSDLNLTSPAASIALGLWYLRTERQDVADILTIPDSVMALNHIQPNFLLIRTIARSLIMWDGIKPTKEWIHGQIPVPIYQAMEAKMRGEIIDDAVELAYYHIISGSCFAIALKYAGTAREEAYCRVIEYYDFFCRVTGPASAAFDHKIKRAAVRDGLNLICMSLNMIMAGTGEINCLRRLRFAHGMYNHPVRYGSHMATHMSLGLLFLGGGRFTLGNSDAAVACMLAAFYPHFPPISSDNRGYLPALRHLWVLAVEPRCLIARDVDTREVVYLPMKIRVKEENGIGGAQLISPTLIPSLDRLLSIKVDTPRYWPFLLDIANNQSHKATLLRNQTLFVKRRTMFLSYSEDAKGSRSLFARSGMSTGDAATLDFPQLTDTSAHPASDVQRFITSHSNDVSFIAFADRFCRGNGNTEEENLFNAFCHAALLDCIIQDKPQILSSYLTLYHARVITPRSRFFQLTHQELLRTSDFYLKLFERRYSGRPEGIARPALLRENSVHSAVHAMDQKLKAVQQRPEFQRALRAFVLNQSDSADLQNSKAYPDLERDLAWYLSRHSAPYAPYYPLLRQFAQDALAGHSSRPPPMGIMGTNKEKELEEGIKLVVHSSAVAILRMSQYWSIESFEDILKIWQTE